MTSDPTFEMVARQRATARGALVEAIRPGALWSCGCCGHERKRPEGWFSPGLLRAQVWVNVPGAVVSLALDDLIDEGLLEVDTRFRVRVVSDRCSA